MTAESDLRRYREQAIQLRTQISKASATVADKRKKAAAARAAADKTKSDATRRSKAREAESAEKAANEGEKKRSYLEKKLADVEKKIATAQGKYDKEQQASQKKALDAIKKQNAAAARQFAPPRRLGDPPREPFAPDRHPGGLSPRAFEPFVSENDVFLSYASEDKDEVARPLKGALEARGLSVWFDEIKIKGGLSIRQEIEKGIARARFGVVILSPDFFAKQWTQAELDALFSKKTSTGENLILPVWHRVTKDQVHAQSPLLAGILTLNTSLMTVDELADALAEAVRP
ncbi:TIR domain-containing protein [Nocardioides sp. ChNu-153]|uniref:TIR domain-containing protein n=1 Tax=unclassified Nocardioides TaxID=2615069 RepID=UPI002405D8FA|nr:MULTISPECIES: TIR domain-containing protein [unclassified Nocardioides]MDF9716632.1 TIR domain-containing protein [Nocardioides sp. ChNu-99]MDN7120564.1 TIR domain-containing protein [Nocardioides sp. ChNu-153]